MKAKYFFLLTLLVIVVFVAYLVVRHHKGVASMNAALQGSGSAELTSIELQAKRSNAQPSRSFTDKRFLAYMQQALGSSQKWRTKVHRKFEKGRPTPVEIVFRFSDGSSYSPDMAVIRGDKYLILAVNQFDGWPTHLIKLSAPIPNELSGLLNIQNAKKEKEILPEDLLQNETLRPCRKQSRSGWLMS